MECGRRDSNPGNGLGRISLVELHHQKKKYDYLRKISGMSIKDAAKLLNVRIDTFLAWLGELEREGKIIVYITAHPRQ